MKTVRQTYQQRAEQFAAACDIGFKTLSEADLPDDEKRTLLVLS